MDTQPLKNIGLSDNEIKIYLTLLSNGPSTAYQISQKTSIYRVHVYDKLEQLMEKGLVNHLYLGAKKYFQATDPKKIKDYLDEKKKDIEQKEKDLDFILPELNLLINLPKDDTKVEVFKGTEGLKYFLKDIIKTKKEVLVSGIEDRKYEDELSIFMKQYFRDLKNNKINERVITVKRKNIFLFNKKLAPTTNYRFLEITQFNPTNTFIYGNKVVIVSWGNPITAIMIKNNEIAETYRNHFEYLWSIASRENK